MEIIILSHARQRMELRGVSEDMIRDTISQPEAQDAGYLGRSLKYKKFGDKYLKVVCEVEEEIYRVITVIWKSKL